MIQAFKSLFAVNTLGGNHASDPERREERLKVATCVVLLEMALADDEFADSERESVIQALRTRFSISGPEADELIGMAAQQRKERNDLWGFTHQINESCNHDEKIEIMDEVWRVVFADGSIGGHENHLAHQLGNLFNLTHGQLMDSKTKILKEVREA